MKKIRMILPVMAILCAGVFAFATNVSPKDLVKQRVSIKGGPCDQNGFCNEATTGTACRYQNDGSTELDIFTIATPVVCDTYSHLGTWSEE